MPNAYQKMGIFSHLHRNFLCSQCWEQLNLTFFAVPNFGNSNFFLFLRLPNFGNDHFLYFSSFPTLGKLFLIKFTRSQSWERRFSDTTHAHICWSGHAETRQSPPKSNYPWHDIYTAHAMPAAHYTPKMSLFETPSTTLF